jgi:N-acetylglucosamine-6-phosphate deacetylase
MRLGVQAALVGGRIVPGDVEVRDGRVAAVGVQPAGADGVALPGFVDVHINGFAGVDFLTAGADGFRDASVALAATGVTGFLPTFVSSPPQDVRRALGVVAGLGELPGARVLGVHLEGPFLSPDWAGAHDPAALRPPDPVLADALLDAGPVRMVTLAPELPGGLELVAHLAGRGVVVSVGHTDADAGTTHRAFDAGARAITHLYNAHRRWQPRDPGPAGAALVRPDVHVQVIVDDVHLAPESAYAAHLAARERFCLVTDAIDGAGLEPGARRLGLREIHVRDGAGRLADGTLAGSVLTMDRAVRNLVAHGAGLEAAAHAASGAPARLLGRTDLGRLAVGGAADVTVVDDALRVVRTLVGGRQAWPG